MTFYLIFIIHLDFSQSLFSTIIRSIKKEERNEFIFLREYLLFKFNSDHFNIYDNISKEKVFELAKKLDYVE
jgi:hypothetical protein